MELKGSKTEANLLAAFAGESQARNKYDYYASRARESAERRPADPDARTSRVQGAACLRVLLPRLPREMVEGAEGD